jgi:MFS family permease
MTRDLLFLAFSMFTWGAGEGMFFNFQTLYLEKQWNASPEMIGAILGGIGIAMTVAHSPAGWLSDRFGSRPIMWASWILGMVSAGMMMLANSLETFIIALLLYGLTSFVMAPMNSYIARAADGKLSVGRSLTLISALYNLGMASGAVVGGLVADQYGLHAIYEVSFIVFIFSTAAIFFLRSQPKAHHEHAHIEAGIPLQHNMRFIVLLVISFSMLFAAYLPQPFTPNYLAGEHQLTFGEIGQLGLVGFLGNAIIMLLLGNLKPILGLLAGQVFMLAYAFILWQANAPFWFAAAFFCIGGYRLIRSMVLAYARPLFHPREIGFAFGLIETVNGAAIIFSPMLAGFLYHNSANSMYFTSVVLIAVIFVFSLVILAKLKHPIEKPTALPE